MKARDYNAQAAQRTAAQQAGDEKRRAAIAKRRLKLAGDELIAAQRDLATIATTSTEPVVADLADARKETIGTTLNNIRRGNEAIP